ncbi:MAG TPA: glycoside hydrolase family 15 protein [Chloroflexota bacterium]|nr:glycoside hydrolase family 15 protein [Chloroflexota bacterium]
MPGARFAIGRLTSYPPIADYGLIGDCRTAALVSRAGSIDWYCPGRFDAPAVFCRLLDARLGGFCAAAPAGRFAAQRRYLPGTNVLETTFEAAGGTLRLVDFMPVDLAGRDPHPGRIVRGLEALGGEVEVEVRFKPTFDYARASADVTLVPAGGAVATAGDQSLALACPGLALRAGRGGALVGRLTLVPGERRWLVLAPDLAAAGPDGGAELAWTVERWRRWADQCGYRGTYRELVRRSALALKLLTYLPTGAVVAAPTTSLPEEVGGARNWDYRYTWLRDASLMLYALSTLGYQRSATDFIRWLERTVMGDPTALPQIMYTVDGGRDLAERALGHLEGYRGSHPVRVGNAASAQHQLDIFGDVLTAAYHFYGGEDAGFGATAPTEPVPARAWQLLRHLVDDAVATWQRPDSGLWEVRGGPRHFVYSKLMCWAAVDRGLRLAEELRLEAPLGAWRAARDAIRQAILSRGFDEEQGAFVQAFGSTALDAAALAIPRVGFLPATDPRVQSTVDRIRSELTRDGLVLRYRADDGLPGSEGTFALCTFWLVDALALGGRLDEAHALFERLVGYANDLGLLSEEVDPEDGSLLGNFPQGFSHMALIGAAANLSKTAKHGAEAEPHTEGQRAVKARHAAAEGHG